MEENKEGTQQAAQEAYVRQLAELSARVLHMTEEQKQRNAAKIEELNKRVAALPPALRGLYAGENGTGKELVARRLHAGSARAAGCAGAAAARC